MGIILEAAATVGMPMINLHQRRIRQEYETASTLEKDATKGQIPVLFLGNPLTLTDLEINRLAAQLGPRYRVSRLAIEETSYLDWCFAWRRLFREGSRPQVAVLGARSYRLSASQASGGYRDVTRTAPNPSSGCPPSRPGSRRFRGGRSR